MEILLRIKFVVWKIGNRLGAILRRRAAPPDIDRRKKEWSSIHQQFELRYHGRRNYRWDDASFFGQWDLVFDHFLGLTRSSFDREETMLDIGCGSRPAFDWFNNSSATKYYLDPLLRSFRSIPSMSHHWQDKPTRNLLDIPAEEYVNELKARCDFILCWNVLDHAYDWETILRNIVGYARKGALVCIGTDFMSHGIGHPGIDNKKRFYDVVNTYFEVAKEASNYVNRDVALKLIRNSKQT